MENSNVKTAEDLAKNEKNALCAFSFWDFGALIDMKPKSGAVYIHSSSEPYTEEQELSEDRVDAWIKHFDMNKFQSHCSGHARGRDGELENGSLREGVARKRGGGRLSVVR